MRRLIWVYTVCKDLCVPILRLLRYIAIPPKRIILLKLLKGPVFLFNRYTEMMVLFHYYVYQGQKKANTDGRKTNVALAYPYHMRNSCSRFG